MPNKAFIFDWSGTLSDNFHLFCKVCDLMFTELGRQPISPEEIRRNFTLPYMRFWNKYFPQVTREQQERLYEKYIHQVGPSKLHDQVEETMFFLNERGYKLFILSSDFLSTLLPEIKKTGFADLIAETVGEAYEKKDYIPSFIKNHSLDREQTFYVGDTSGDVEAGKHAQVKTVGISWGAQHRDLLSAANPDFLIDDIVEIKNIVERI